MIGYPSAGCSSTTLAATRLIFKGGMMIHILAGLEKSTSSANFWMKNLKSWPDFVGRNIFLKECQFFRQVYTRSSSPQAWGKYGAN
jgi:hypothetical protein